MKLWEIKRLHRKMFYRRTGKAVIESNSILKGQSRRISFYESKLKRPMDRNLAILLIIILSPLFLIISILIRWKLGGPVIYRQKRPGLNEKIFTLYKFRSMTNERGKDGKLLPDAMRLNQFGAYLRSTSLDELPELWNIAKGDMSFVGPRPLLRKYLGLYSKEQRRRHEVRPGLTGYAQVKGRNALGWEDRFQLDLKYIEHISFMKDLSILLQTIRIIVKREGISSSQNVTMEPFEGNKAFIGETKPFIRERNPFVRETKPFLREGKSYYDPRVNGKKHCKSDLMKRRDSLSHGQQAVKKGLVILGAGGHGKVVADIAMKMDRWEVICFLDDGNCASCLGFEIIGKFSETKKFVSDYDFIVALGSNSLRQQYQEKLESEGASLVTLLHPSAILGKQVRIEAGSVVMAGVVINSATRIGKGCIINTGSTIDHDNRIANYVHISPGVHLAGEVTIGKKCWLGIGTTVRNKIQICNGTMVGAGAVVVKDCSLPGIYMGVPARRVDNGTDTNLK